MLGMKLVTKQTGDEGKIVHRILVEKATNIKQEIYLSIMVDRDNEQHILIASAEGGTEIETLAESRPDAIIKEKLSAIKPMGFYQGRKIAKKLGLTGSLLNKFSSVAVKLHQVFIDYDCMLLEINPLVVNSDDEIVCLDSKITVDDNALFRHSKIEEMKDYGEMEPQEVRASIYDLSYVSMEGNIGCMVNGAGLAMATMDIIKSYGGRPANFLDVGGGADENKVREAFRIILTDPNVSVIFVNIFGGIVRCDLIAKGVLKAAEEVPSDKHVVLRLDGTNVEQGKAIINKEAATTGLNIYAADTMADAAQTAVKLANGETVKPTDGFHETKAPAAGRAGGKK
jgi:succinyl-CoA synthetase beta subunit